MTRLRYAANYTRMKITEDSFVQEAPRFTAFFGTRRVAAGSLEAVALALRSMADGNGGGALVFDDATGRVVDLDLRGSNGDIVERLKSHPLYGATTHGVAPQGGATSDPAGRRGRGRPRLGVVAREVTLLPRHWEWLNAQPGGASVALRKLVDEARRAKSGRDRARLAQEATYRFVSAMAGNEPGYEEATRALFAADRQRFQALIRDWPADIAGYAAKLADEAFAAAGGNI